MSKIFSFDIFVSCTILVLTVSPSSAQICNIHCDGRDPSQATNSREAVSVEIFGRQVRLYISDIDNMGFAQISNGAPTDEVWIDRSFDGGVNWNGKLGDTFIPSGSNEVRTVLYNVDNPSSRQIGALRACGKAGNREDIACTSWTRSTVNAETRADAAATALMQFYNGKLFSNAGWWNSANCLTAILDYIKYSGSQTYNYIIDEMYEKNKEEHFGDFNNDYIDDTLWWGLAWVRAYELTGNPKYLETAKHNADYCYDGYRDDVCGGGLWWRIDRGYKGAIENELFIKLAAELHNKIPGDTKYLNQAIEVWNWFKNSGMINSENLVNNGLTSDCRNDGLETWTYNQGVILGGLTELFKATGDENYLLEARRIADAVRANNTLNPNDVLKEYGCEYDSDCGYDGPTFKGAFIRGLGELNRELPDRPYTDWIRNQGNSNWDNNRNSLNQFGLRWEGPLDKADPARQHSVLEAFVAAL